MNYLQLCQRLHQEIGGGPGPPGSQPTTVSGQSGDNLRLVTWINQAYTEIQEACRNWLWMMTTGSRQITTGNSTVALTGITDFDGLLPFQSESCVPYILCQKTSVGATDQQPCYYISYDDFTGFYDRGTWVTRGRPIHFSVTPDNTLTVFTKVDVDYTFTFRYRKAVQTLAADSDTPTLPVKFHMLIVYLAMAYYGLSNESNRINKNYGLGLWDDTAPSSPLTTMFRRLRNEQLAEIR